MLDEDVTSSLVELVVAIYSSVDVIIFALFHTIICGVLSVFLDQVLLM